MIGAGGGVAHHPGQHVAVALARERVGDVGPGLAGRGNRGEPQAPQLAVRRRGGERVVMIGGERLEPDAVALEGDGAKLDHEVAPRSRGGSGHRGRNFCTRIPNASTTKTAPSAPTATACAPLNSPS